MSREALVYLAALALWTLVSSAACFWLLRASYAGVSEEGGAAEAAMAAYPDYLRSVGLGSAALLAVGIAALFLVTVGLVTVYAPSPSPKARFLRALGLALLVHAAWLGAEAGRHPGLFLGLLTANRVAPYWVACAEIVWPALLVGSALAWGRFAIETRRFGERAVAVLAIAGAAAWLWAFEIHPLIRNAHVDERGGPPPSRGAVASGRARYPNVLLVGIDSLRPDKIDQGRTPVLARLLEESIYFSNTLVTIPRTAPSWTALLTSLPPLANGIETMFPSAARARLTEVAMPAHLASLGYATMVLSEYAGESFGRVELGFQERSVPRVELEQMLGQGLLGRQPAVLAFAGQLYTASDWLRRALPAPLPELMRGLASFSYPEVLSGDLLQRLDASRPWFALVFYSQPHFPYTSSRPFHGRYAVAEADPALRFGKDVASGEVVTEADRAQIDALYRAALAETDAALGDLLARLEIRGALDDTIVVVTADHGEGLYECASCLGHGDNLRGMMSLRVPLAFRLPKPRFPDATPRAVPGYVSQLDVYPTLLALLDVARPPVQEGEALLTAEGKLASALPERIFFAETGEWLWPTRAVPTERIDYPPITALATIEQGRIIIDERHLPVIRAAKHRAAMLPPWKLVYRPTPRAVEWALYDIDRDPLEEHDLAETHAEIAARLRTALVHSVLRFSHMLPAGDYFLTRPPPPREEYY